MSGQRLPSLSTRGLAPGFAVRGAPRIPAVPHPGWALGTEIVQELLNIHVLRMKALAVQISVPSSSRCLVPRAAESKALQGGNADPGAGDVESEMQNLVELSSQSPAESFLSRHKAFPGRRAGGRRSACEAAEGGCGELFWGMRRS